MSENGAFLGLLTNISVTFVLREARPTLEKKPMPWEKRMTVNLTMFTRGDEELAASVMRYFERGLR